MVSKHITLKNTQGFHIPPASVFTTEMEKFSSKIIVKYEDTEYNGKSLLNIVSACIKCGSEIEIICNGDDENEALAKAVDIIENKLS